MIDRDVARRVRLVGLDVDGVLTEGGIYLGDVGGSPLELKRYDIQDGFGMSMLRAVGIKLAIVTGRVSQSVAMRAAELCVDHVVQDAHARKLPALRELLQREEIALDDVAFLGDDFPDLAVLRVVGLPVAVGNAVPEIRAACAVHLSQRGGHGAVREFAEALLRARGEWESATERYVRERSASPAGARS
ncbi:MAG TPA: HAD hydrolase family protein [Gemmatimonadaceae bacterium]|nr:HAD hydrolase family protein [Gemmatimonadaceae bacterium]